MDNLGKVWLRFARFDGDGALGHIRARWGTFGSAALALFAR